MIDNQAAQQGEGGFLDSLRDAAQRRAPESGSVLDQLRSLGVDPASMTRRPDTPLTSGQRADLQLDNALGMGGQFISDAWAGRRSDIDPYAAVSAIAEAGATKMLGETAGAAFGGVVGEIANLVGFSAYAPNWVSEQVFGMSSGEALDSAFGAVGMEPPTLLRMAIDRNMSSAAFDDSAMENRLRAVDPKASRAEASAAIGEYDPMSAPGIAKAFSTAATQLGTAIGMSMIPGGQGAGAATAARSVGVIGRVLAPARAMLTNPGGKAYLGYMGGRQAIDRGADYRRFFEREQQAANVYNDALDRTGLADILGKHEVPQDSRLEQFGVSVASGLMTAASELIGTGFSVAAGRRIASRLLGRYPGRAIEGGMGAVLREAGKRAFAAGGMEGLEEVVDGYGQALIGGIYDWTEEGGWAWSEQTGEPMSFLKVAQNHAPNLMYDFAIAFMVSAPLGGAGGLASVRRGRNLHDAFAMALLRDRMAQAETGSNPGEADFAAAQIIAESMANPGGDGAATQTVLARLREVMPEIGQVAESQLTDPAWVRSFVENFPILAMRLSEMDSLSRMNIEWLTGPASRGRVPGSAARGQFLESLRSEMRTLIPTYMQGWFDRSADEIRQYNAQLQQLGNRTDDEARSLRALARSRIHFIRDVRKRVQQAWLNKETIDQSTFQSWLRLSEASEAVDLDGTADAVENSPHTERTAPDDIKSLLDLARQGDNEASFELARRYEAGEGVEQHYYKSQYWLNLALSRLGDVDAMVWMGKYYEGRIQTYPPTVNQPRSIDKARALYRRAYEMGSDEAGSLLAELESRGQPTPAVPRPGRVDAARPAQAPQAAPAASAVPQPSVPQESVRKPQAASEGVRTPRAATEAPVAAEAATEAPAASEADPAAATRRAIEGRLRVEREAQAEAAAREADAAAAEADAPRSEVERQVQKAAEDDGLRVRFVEAETEVERKIAKGAGKLGRRVQFITIMRDTPREGMRRRRSWSGIRGFVGRDADTIYLVRVPQVAQSDRAATAYYLQTLSHENAHGLIQDADQGTLEKADALLNRELIMEMMAFDMGRGEDAREEIRVHTLTLGVTDAAALDAILLADTAASQVKARLKLLFSRVKIALTGNERAALLQKLVKAQVARVKAAEAAKPKPATAASLNAAVAAGDTVTATTERGGEMQEVSYGKDAEFIERRGVLYAKVGKTLDRLDSPAVVPAKPAVGKAKAKKATQARPAQVPTPAPAAPSVQSEVPTPAPGEQTGSPVQAARATDKATPKPEPKPQAKPRRGRGETGDGQGVLFMREIGGFTTFSGGGLMDIAMEQMGIRSDGRIEIRGDIAAVADQNLPGVTTVLSILDADPASASRSDILHGSPVCKGYSCANATNHERELDILTAKALMRFLETNRNPIFTLENVRKYGRPDSEAMNLVKATLDRLGYTYDINVYNAADYGAAQFRERLMLRAVRDGDLPPMPEPTHGPGRANPYVGWFERVSDLIDDLPDDKIPLRSKDGTKPSYIAERLARIGIDPMNVSEPMLLQGGSASSSNLPIARASEPSWTVKSTHKEAHRILMPGGIVKRVTPRVLARLQGMPDSYKLPSDIALATTIVGNGVPVELGRAVLGSLVGPMAQSDGGLRFMRERVTDVLDSFRDESDSSSRTSHLATELMWKYTVLDRAVKAARRKMNIDPEDAANELFQLAPGTVSRILQDFGNAEQKPFEEAVKALAKRLGISRERVFDKVQEHAFYKHAIDVMAWVKDRDAEEIARRAKRQQEMLTDMGVDVDPDALYAEVLKSMTALGVDEGKASERLAEIEKEFAADPAWSNLSGQLRAMNRKTLEIRRESGQITETAYQELVKRYPNYVPVVVSIFDESVTSETDEVTRPARRSLRAMRGIGESKRPIREYWAANWDLTKADRMSAAHAASLMPGDNAMFRLAMMEALKTASGENLLEVVDMQAMIGTEVRRLKMDLIKDRDAAARKARERGEEPAAFEMPSDEVLTERAAQQVRTDLDMDVAGTSTQTPTVRRFKLERDMDMTDPRVYDDIELFARTGLTAAQTEANEQARADGKPLPHTPVKTGTKAHERKMEQLQDKIRIMPKGTVMHYRIKDPMLAQAMLLNEPTWIERWRNEGGKVKRSLALGWLKLMAYQRFAFVTASPSFWKGELFRSPQQAQIMARVMSQEMGLPPEVQEEFLRNVDALNGAPVWPLVGVFGAFKALPGRKPWRSVRHVMRGGDPRNEYETLVRQAMEDGVMQGSLYSVADYESMQADLRDRVRRLTGASGTRMDRVRQKLSNVSDVMKTVTDSIDMITGGLDFVNRMVVYQAALMSGISRQQAAVMARESTVDFSKKGTKTRGLSQMYLFLGPRMQGIHQLLRAFSTGDGAGAARIATSASMRALMRMFLWAFVIKMMREFFWEDDDEPQTQPSQFASLQNMLIPMPLDSEKGQHIYLELNNPYGFGAIAKLADRIGEFLVGDATPLETIAGATGDFASELTPLAFNAADPSSIIQAVTPTNLQFATDLILNQDWKGSPVYPEGAKFGPGEQRRSQQYFAANTWRTSIWMADVIADLTRPIAQGLGFEGQRGIEISPNQIQYVFQRWMPGLVRQAVDGASWATGSRVTVDRLPIIGSFVTQTGGQGVLAGQWRDLGTIRANMKVDIKEGRESMRDLLERYGSVGRWLERGGYDRAANAIKKLQQARNQAERAGQPRERINRLDDRIEEIRERVLREYAMVRKRETGGGIDQMVGESWRGRSR